MTGNTTSIHGTARLFMDRDFDPSKSRFATLKGTGHFEIFGPYGLQHLKIDVVAYPKEINGRNVYQLTAGSFDGLLQRTALDIRDYRFYLGHVGPFEEFLVTGLMRDASEDLPSHIELTFIWTENAFRNSKAENRAELQCAAPRYP